MSLALLLFLRILHDVRFGFRQLTGRYIRGAGRTPATAGLIFFNILSIKTAADESGCKTDNEYDNNIFHN
jgi:hypothetical protein